MLTAAIACLYTLVACCTYRLCRRSGAGVGVGWTQSQRAFYLVVSAVWPVFWPAIAVAGIVEAIAPNKPANW